MQLEKRIELVFADSKAYKTTKNDWLQGGIMNIFREKVVALLKKIKYILIVQSDGLLI